MGPEKDLSVTTVHCRRKPFFSAAIGEYISEDGFGMTNKVHNNQLTKNIKNLHYGKFNSVARCKAAQHENPIVVIC